MPQLPINIYHEPYHFGLNLPKRFSPSAARFARMEANLERTKRSKDASKRIARGREDMVLDYAGRAKAARAKRDSPFKIAPETARTRARAWLRSQNLDPNEHPERVAEIQRALMQDPRRKFSPEELAGGKTLSPRAAGAPAAPATQSEDAVKPAPKASGKGASWGSNFMSPLYALRETLGMSQAGGDAPAAQPERELVGPVETNEDGVPFRRDTHGQAVTVNDDPTAPAQDAPLQEKIDYRSRTGKHPPGVLLADEEAIEKEERRTRKHRFQIARMLDRFAKATGGQGQKGRGCACEGPQAPSRRDRRVLPQAGGCLHQETDAGRAAAGCRQETAQGHQGANAAGVGKVSPRDSLVAGLVPKPTDEERMARIRGMATAAGTDDPGGLRRLADHRYAIDQVTAAREAEQYAVRGKSAKAYYQSLQDFNPFRPGSTMRKPGKETAVERLVTETIANAWEEGMSLDDLQEALRPQVEKVIGVWEQIKADGEVEEYMEEAEARGGDVAAFAKAILKNPQAVWAEARYLADREWRIRNRIDIRAQADQAAKKTKPEDAPETVGDEDGPRKNLWLDSRTGDWWEEIKGYEADDPILGRVIGGGDTATRPSVDPEIVRARSNQVIKGLKQEAGTEIRDWSKASVAQAYGAVVDAALAGGAGENFYVPRGSRQSTEITDMIHGAIQRQGSNWDEDPQLLDWALKYVQDDPVKGKMVLGLVKMLHGVMEQNVPDEKLREKMRRMFEGKPKKGNK